MRKNFPAPHPRYAKLARKTGIPSTDFDALDAFLEMVDSDTRFLKACGIAVALTIFAPLAGAQVVSDPMNTRPLAFDIATLFAILIGAAVLFIGIVYVVGLVWRDLRDNLFTVVASIVGLAAGIALGYWSPAMALSGCLVYVVWHHFDLLSSTRKRQDEHFERVEQLLHNINRATVGAEWGIKRLDIPRKDLADVDLD